MAYFQDGFTEFSYFNICKKITYNFYNERMDDKNLNLFYSDDEELNACACVDKNNNDYLIINAGTFVEVFALMKTAFSQKDLFYEIGDSSIETNNIIFGEYDEELKQVSYTGKPKDEYRDFISNYCCFNFVLKFIALHEMGHIVDGHTRLLNKLYAKPEIYMRLEKAINNKMYCLDRRTLEMDADAVAISALFDHVATTYKDCIGKEPLDRLKSPEDIFKLWSFSIAILFMYFEVNAPSEYDPNGYYLPNNARFKLAMLAAKENAKLFIKHGIVKELEPNKNKIISAIINGIDEASRLIERIFNIKLDWLSTFEDEKFDFYSNEVLNNWDNRLKKKLEKYARVTLYNPETVEADFIKAMSEKEKP